MNLRPIYRAECDAFIVQHHRHHAPPPGAILRVGAEHEGQLVGVAVAGRPVARTLDDGKTLEVTRVATDGSKNVCSMLYGALVRAGKALGYTRFVTYTLPEEGGASLRAAGWREDGQTAGGAWCRNAPLLPLMGVPEPNTTPKTRWMLP